MKKIIIVSVLATMLFTILYIFGKVYIEGKSRNERLIIQTEEYEVEQKNVVDNDKTVKQTFASEFPISSIEIEGSAKEGKTVEILLENETAEVTLYHEKVKVNKNLYYIPINDQVQYSSKQIYTLSIDGENELRYKVFTKGIQNEFRIWLFLSLLLVAFFITALVIASMPMALERRIFITAIFLGILYMLIFPPKTIPDEDRHIDNAYRISNMLLGHGYALEDGSMLIRAEDMKISQYTRKNTLSNHMNNIINFTILSEDNELLLKEGYSITRKILPYLPSVLGITLARILHLGCLPLLYLGRICNLLFFCVCLYATIKITPIGKKIFAAVALLPMTMHQVSSFSYDAVINGLSFVCIALCLKIIYEKSNKKLILPLIGAFIWLAACKSGIYVIIIILLLQCVKFTKVFKRKNVMVFLGGAGVIITGSILLQNQIFAIINAPQIGENYSPFYILQEPIEFSMLLMNTFMKHADFYLRSMLGGHLGWLDIKIPDIFIMGFLILIILSLFKEESDTNFIPPKLKVINFLIIIGIILCTEVAASTWTPITVLYFDGVQGRYFIPILPLVLLNSDNSVLVYRKNIEAVLIFSLGIMQTLTLLSVMKTTFLG